MTDRLDRLNRIMRDLHAEMERSMLGDVLGLKTNPKPYEPMTIEKLHAAMDLLKPPPMPSIHISKAATALPEARPHTDDMREMVAALGRQRIPVVYRIKAPDGSETYVVHPDLFKPKKGHQND